MRKISLVLIALFFGCATEATIEITDPDTRTRHRQERFMEETQFGTENQIADSLPSGAENIKYLGNNWWQFDLTVDGFRHTFICRTFPRNHANSVNRFSAITEVGASNARLP